MDEEICCRQMSFQGDTALSQPALSFANLPERQKSNSLLTLLGLQQYLERVRPRPQDATSKVEGMPTSPRRIQSTPDSFPSALLISMIETDQCPILLLDIGCWILKIWKDELPVTRSTVKAAVFSLTLSRNMLEF